MSYDTMRHFADSWGLVAMAVMFLVLTGWAFRRGARAHHDAAARSIFDEERSDG